MIYALFTVSGPNYDSLRHEAQSDAAIGGFDTSFNLCVMYCTPLKLEPGGRVETWHGWAVIYTGDIHIQQKSLLKLIAFELQKRRILSQESSSSS